MNPNAGYGAHEQPDDYKVKTIALMSSNMWIQVQSDGADEHPEECKCKTLALVSSRVNEIAKRGRS